MIDKNPENKSFSVGTFALVNKFYSKLELQDVIGRLKSKGIPLDKLTKGMITYKISHNLSIHKGAEWLNQLHILNQFQLKNFNERALYRALEIIGQNEELVLTKLKNKLFSKFKFEHTDINLDWSSIVLHGTASSLGRFGFSSDHRPDKRQITFGVGQLRKPINVPITLTIKEGNIPSNKHFNDTFLRCVKHLKPDSLIVIDRGANTKSNKKLVKSNSMHYLTARILTRKDNILFSKFSKLTAKKIIRTRNKRGKEIIYCKKIKENNEFLYICFSEKLHENQITKKERKIDIDLKIIKQLSRKLKAGGKIKQTINLPDKILLHETSIQKKIITSSEKEVRNCLEKIYFNGREGFYVLESSKNLTEKEAIEIYKSKDSIEKTMHSLKNEIEIKPVRVWSTSSISGALIIGFLAQLFISLVRFESDKLKSLSTTTILESLKNLTLTIKSPKNRLIEQIISNIDWICKEILPDFG